jgi:hypothetical protein
MIRRHTNACMFLADVTVRYEEKERNYQQLTCHDTSSM